MSRKERDHLRSEVGTLERFLLDLTEHDVIERVQLEHQLVEARKRLAALETQPQSMPLPITFRGQPVEGTRSIDATFAAQALKAFVEATDTVAASLVSDDLKGRGRLPGAGERSLRIVDTAVGSFGFELELPALVTDDSVQKSLLPEVEEVDPYVEAINTTLALLDEAATDDEDAISDLVAKVHPRAAAKVRAFAKVLADHHALFAAAFEGKQVRFDEGAQVRRVVDALKDEDISEDDETHTGTLLGVLPHSRDFEARLHDGALVRGKVDRGLGELSVFKQTWESVEACLRFRVVHVRTNRRYVLTAAAALTADRAPGGSLEEG
jgi:hypothetical protein